MTTFFIGIEAPITCYDHLIKEPFKPIPVGERHLTLAYLGTLKVPKQQVYYRLHRLLEQHRPQPFKLEFNKLGPYPSWKKIRYIAAIPRPCPRLEALHQMLRDGLRDLTRDRWHAFSPHVSIAFTREKTTPRLWGVAEEIVRGGVGSCVLEVRDMAFFMARGGRYFPVRRFHLFDGGQVFS